MTSRRLVTLLLAAAALLHPVVATAATDGPSEPPPSAPATGVPAEVSDWFAEEGGDAVADLGEELTLGPARRVATWNEAYVAGEEPEVPATPVQEWVAAAVRRGAEAPEAVGVVRAGAADGSLQLLDVTEDAELAAALHEVPSGTVVIRDDTVEGWFGLLDGEVWPLTEGARSVLQGSLPAEVFQEFLAAWRGEAPPAAVPSTTEDDGGTLSPLIPIGVIVLAGAGVAILLLRQYRQADSRIAADVHAGMAPPPEDGDGDGDGPRQERPEG
ncbi:hypothetical protein SAMN05216184_103239 [Georgenia satyanarayanai]|uniref:Uncharacterized protein n=1 Tax=Georgenia satyanarayanai TaxID=860221 RepID=A0A2Y9A713_9MICO|nr:hypothetical protein [Georgenia satyanarayanai]PYG00666.1 hypothetical protein A8987_103239 [Georgenia satyanarayanai]SSA40055.1 hypothetical protein SAMN05216184_103239 [Georgenia satyanarayanai]